MAKGKYTDADLAPSPKKGKYTDADLAVDFTGGPDNSEGKYQMKGKDGKVIPVAYSKVSDAFKSGLRLTTDDAKRYVTDSAADPTLKKQSPAYGVKYSGKNSAGQLMVAPDDSLEGSAAERLFSSAGSAIGGAVKGSVQLFNPKPNEYEKQHGLTTAYDAALSPLERLVEPQVQQGEQAIESAKKGDISEAAGHGLAAVVPGVGPWASSVGEQIGAQVGQGNYAGAAGTLAGNAAVYAAPHAVGKVARVIKKTPRTTLEAVTNTSPREIRDAAEKVQKANREAEEKTQKQNTENTTKHLEDTQEALHKTQGAELETSAENKAAAEKARADHAAEVAKAQEHNQRVLDKHKAVSERIQQENDAADHALDLRRAEEAKLQQETADYYAKEDAVKAKVKADTDATWKPWHDKMKGVTVDGGQIEVPLERILKVSPEVRRVIQQLTPDPSDASDGSQYAQDRAAIMKSQGITGNYWDLPLDKRGIIDQIASSSGFEPEPIDFDPKAGVAIPIETIHRAKSIIGRNIASGKYEGPLLGEMKQLFKILDQTETRASLANGADTDLKAGRQATRQYMEAFGRDRHLPRTQDEIRKQQANPEQFKEDNDQERLNAAKKHDPSLASDYEKVKAHREAVKKMQTEDQLRKAKKQVPLPPTMNDLREGYRLKPMPKYVDPAPAQPVRTAPPNRPLSVQAAMEYYDKVNPNATSEDRQGYMNSISGNPPEVVPELKSISPQDLKAKGIENIKATATNLRNTGLRRALYATLTGLPFAVIELFTRAGATGAGEAALGGLAAGGVVLAGSHMLANLLENPKVSSWLTKVTDRDTEVWNKLPPEQKSLFTEDMRQLLEAAKDKNIKVSPALDAFVAGESASQGGKKDPLAEMRAKAKELQDRYAPTPVPVAPQPVAPVPQVRFEDDGSVVPGPESSAKPVWTHRFNPDTGEIEAA